MLDPPPREVGSAPTRRLSSEAVLPLHTPLCDLHFQQKLRLDAARLVWADGTTSTLDSFTFTSEMKDVSVVRGAVLPRDV